MSNTAFSGLSVAVALAGNEIVPISAPTGNDQAPYVSMRTTVSAIANYWLNLNASTVTRRQLYSALAGTGVMATVYQAVNADPNSQNWVDFSTSFTVTRTSGLALFIQTTLGYSDAQMDALFVSALTYPA